MMAEPVSIFNCRSLEWLHKEKRAALNYLAFGKVRPDAVTRNGLARAEDYVARIYAEIVSRDATKGG